MFFQSDVDINYVHNTQVLVNMDHLNKFCASTPCSQLTVSNNLVIFHCNIRSIRANFDELMVLLNSSLKYIHVIVLTEIWISENEVQLYQINNFKSFGCCRDVNRSGGVLVYVNNNLDFSINLDWNIISAEGLILYSKNLKLGLIAMYRSHSYTADFYINELGSLLKTLKFDNSVIIGDININILEETRQSNDYLNLLSENGYSSLINTPTRVSDVSETCIDHIFLKNRAPLKTDTAILSYEVTDHYPILCKIDLKIERDHGNSHEIYTKYDLSKMTTLVNALEFPYDIEDSNNLYHSFKIKIDELIKNCTVHMSKRNPNKNNKWINKSIINLINQKEKLYYKTKKYPYDYNFKCRYKLITKQIKQEIKIAKENYYQSEFARCAGNHRKQWQFINGLIGKNRKQEVSPENLNLDVVNGLNDFFVNCALSEYNCSNHKNSIHNFTNDSFYLMETSNTELSGIINSLNERKSVGYDNMSVRLLKILAKHKPDVLTNITNKSFQQGKFPDELKTACVTPIHKGGDKNVFGNYRPISVLPVFSKVIEKAMKDRLYSFLSKANFFSVNQYGFMKGLGTENALLKFSSTIYNSLNRNLKSVAIFIDISKAFDSVNHDILLRKLYYAGVRGKQHDWFKSYLENREQFIKIKNFVSNKLRIKKGVPQGSILGPLLFIIFINDLCNLKLNGTVITYADDTVLIYSEETNILLKESIESDMLKIKEWFNNNDLIINYKKTKYINFRLKSGHSEDINIKYHVSCNGFSENCNCPLIERVQNIKYLGLFIHETFKWKFHIEKITNKLRYCLYTFYYLKNFVSMSFLKQLYFSWVQSIVSYGITSWGGDYYSNILPLISIQKRFINILNYSVDAPQEDILSVRKLYLYNIMICLFKNKLLCNIKETSYYNFRNVGFFEVPKANKEIFCKSFSYLAPKLYNILPDRIKNINSLPLFKKHVKLFLFEIDEENFLRNNYV